MTATSTIFRAARPAFRQQANFFSAQGQAHVFRSTRSRFQGQGRRWQSTAAPARQQSWFKRMWNSPIGLKTVHFWAPVMKWALVLAGISDFYRPAENLSLTQNCALTATGIIWTRWCLIIKPRNVLLATVNFFLSLVGIIQVTRILKYQYSDEGKSAKAQLEEAAKGLKKDTINAVKS